MVEPELSAFAGRSMYLVEDLMAAMVGMGATSYYRHSPVITYYGISGSGGDSRRRTVGVDTVGTRPVGVEGTTS